MTDFLTWPILHLVSVVNTLMLVWVGKQLFAIKRDVAYIQGRLNGRDRD